MNDDIDDETQLGFEPAVSATGASEDGPDAPRRRRRRSGGLRRRVGASVLMLAALATMGGAYAAFATSSGAAATGMGKDDIEAGRQLYQVSCITCHGANLEGITGQGPTLIGSGAAAVYFQVTTGRMPLAQQGAYAARKPAKFTEAQAEQLAAYVESIGGGPQIPTGDLRADDKTLGDGGALFRINCASCHGTTLKGAPLSAGKIAPSLLDANDKQIYAAMLSGPESMPVFSDNTITPAQKREIINYIQTMKATKDPGGHGIGRIGPVSEAIVVWVGGVGALMIMILWIGAKSR